ncbi:MAG: P-loop NTPase [Oscillospiraceae bacterium]|nr:P-loop NTPase [Oscillospiraceae bacterium]
MSESTHQCGGCGGCGSKQAPQEPQKLPPNVLSKIGKAICIMGGTGKSRVTASLAAELTRRGKQVAILDADIATPGIPPLFEIPQGITRGEAGLYPALTHDGIKILSMSLLLEDETELITTRAAAMAGILSQLWTEIIWDQVDYLLVDMPLGIQDVTQLVLGDLPLDAALILTPPGEYAELTTARLFHLAQQNGVRAFERAQSLEPADITDIATLIEEV